MNLRITSFFSNRPGISPTVPSILARNFVSSTAAGSVEEGEEWRVQNWLILPSTYSAPHVRSQETCTRSRREMLFNTEEEKRVRNVEKKPTRNYGKKGGFKEKEFREKNEENSSYIKTMDVNEVEKITFPPTLIFFLSPNFLSSFTFCSFLPILLLFFSFSLFL